jgi:hypothetical protein
MVKTIYDELPEISRKVADNHDELLWVPFKLAI